MNTSGVPHSKKDIEKVQKILLEELHSEGIKSSEFAPFNEAVMPKLRKKVAKTSNKR